MVKRQTAKQVSLWVTLALALCAAAAAVADTPGSTDTPGASSTDTSGESSSWAYEAAAELMSPFCPGRTLADCPSPNAESLRLWLVVQAAAGRSREEVENELFARYGEVMRPAPKAEGMGLTAYLVPIGAFVLGGLAITLFLRRNMASPALSRPAAVGAPPLDPELERIVDEDLAR